MFKVDIHFSDDTKLEIANASLFHVDGVETQPREIRLDNAKHFLLRSPNSRIVREKMAVLF